jgi:2-haloacid dehalogenase
MWRQKQLEYSWLRSLMNAHADFWQVTRDALDFALSAAGNDDPALRDTLLDLYLSLAPYPEVKSVLSALKHAGYRRAVLSNGAPAMLDAAVRSAGLDDLLNDVLSVEEVGVFKPAPAVYGIAVDRLGLAPQEICFLSSNAWDAAGAAYFGFRVVWVNRFGQVRERLPGKPLHELKTLDALPGLLGVAR